MLSCECPDYEGEGWFYIEPDNFTVLATSKRKRCHSCKELINIGDTYLRFARFRSPKGEIEEKIFSEDTEIAMAHYYMCEKCGDQYFNLSDLGFCINIEENMFELLKEYQEVYIK